MKDLGLAVLQLTALLTGTLLLVGEFGLRTEVVGEDVKRMWGENVTQMNCSRDSICDLLS